MTDPRNPLAALPAVDPSDAAALEARHQLIVGLLGAYADAELPAETVSQLDAHLVGCASCRRELAVHHAVRRRLAAEPPAAAEPALQRRIRAAIAAMPVPAPSPAPAIPGWRRHAVALAAGAVVVAALVAATFLATPELPWRRATEVHVALPVTPVGSDALLGDVLADYRRIAALDLPGRARDLDAVRAAVPFPVEPLRVPELRLLAAWTADIGGEPAAALAYRWDEHVVVQYLVAEARFFSSPTVRARVAVGGALAARHDGTALVAWPTASAGSLLVGDLPPARLATIWTAQRVAERGAGGAH